MQINQCTRSLQVSGNEYLNVKHDKNKCSQNVEKEVSFENNVESRQHDKYQNELLKLHEEFSKYQETCSCI